MDNVVDFQAFKERKIVDAIEFIPPRHEGWCPFCQAPTLIKRTSAGTEVHTFDPTNMEAYDKAKQLLVKIVDYFRSTDEGVSDGDLIEAFGEGMRDFLKELEQERGSN